MSTVSDTFWVLDKLEKHFDRVWVDVDILIGRMGGMKGARGDEIRGKLHTLSVIFSHLGEKSRSVFETNMKQEAQLLHLRDEVSELTASKAVLEKELEGRLIQLHASQVQLQSYMRTENSSELDTVKAKLDSQIDSFKANIAREARLAARVQQLKRENSSLKDWLKESQDISEGAKLTARYLDKELAGRLQEVQLLITEIRSGKNVAVWSQLESEIALNHHKAVVHACRVRARSKGMPIPASRLVSKQRKVLMSNSNGASGSSSDDKDNGVRSVLIAREENESLGLTIAGGRENGLHIIVSALEPGKAAARSEGLYIGDTILAINGQDLRTATHRQAVAVLQKAVGEIQMDVVYLDVEDVEDNEELSEESSQQGQQQVSPRIGHAEAQDNPTFGQIEAQLTAGYYHFMSGAEASSGGEGFDGLSLGQAYYLSPLTDSAAVFNSEYTF